MAFLSRRVLTAYGISEGFFIKSDKFGNRNEIMHAIKTCILLTALQ